jgi:hypothetical protein
MFLITGGRVCNEALEWLAPCLWVANSHALFTLGFRIVTCDIPDKLGMAQICLR